MVIGIVGSRTFSDYAYMKGILDYYFKAKEIDKIVTGDAKGADTLAAKYANENKIELEVFYAKWKTYGKSAGPRRNAKIVAKADMIIAFRVAREPNKGTNDTINKANEKNKDVVICDYQCSS